MLIFFIFRANKSGSSSDDSESDSELVGPPAPPQSAAQEDDELVGPPLPPGYTGNTANSDDDEDDEEATQEDDDVRNYSGRSYHLFVINLNLFIFFIFTGSEFSLILIILLLKSDYYMFRFICIYFFNTTHFRSFSIYEFSITMVNKIL